MTLIHVPLIPLHNKNVLTSHQSLDLFKRLGGIIEMGQRPVKPTTHWQTLPSAHATRSDEAQQASLPLLFEPLAEGRAHEMSAMFDGK